jgi:hypothetical protein
MIHVILAGAIFFAAISPAMAGDSAPTSAAAPAAKTDRDKLVCHREKVMGSLIDRKVCYTQADADIRRQEDRQAVERIESTGLNCHDGKGMEAMHC